MLNKNTKLFLLFSLVLITLVGITAVSAVDVANNATTTLEDATSDTNVNQANVNTLNDNNKNVYKSDVQDTSTVKDTDAAKSVSTKTVEQTNTKQVKGDGDLEVTLSFSQDGSAVTDLNNIKAGKELIITATFVDDTLILVDPEFSFDNDDYFDGDPEVSVSGTTNYATLTVTPTVGSHTVYILAYEDTGYDTGTATANIKAVDETPTELTITIGDLEAAVAGNTINVPVNVTDDLVGTTVNVYLRASADSEENLATTSKDNIAKEDTVSLTIPEDLASNTYYVGANTTVTTGTITSQFKPIAITAKDEGKIDVTLTIDPLKTIYDVGSQVTLTATIDATLEIDDATFAITDEDGIYTVLDGATWIDNVATVTVTLPVIPGQYIFSVEIEDTDFKFGDDSITITVDDIPDSNITVSTDYTEYVAGYEIPVTVAVTDELVGGDLKVYLCDNVVDQLVYQKDDITESSIDFTIASEYTQIEGPYYIYATVEKTGVDPSVQTSANVEIDIIANEKDIVVDPLYLSEGFVYTIGDSVTITGTYTENGIGKEGQKVSVEMYYTEDPSVKDYEQINITDDLSNNTADGGKFTYVYTPAEIGSYKYFLVVDQNTVSDDDYFDVDDHEKLYTTFNLEDVESPIPLGQTITITGTITDENDDLVDDGLTVNLVYGNSIVNTTTTANGEFTLEYTPDAEGTYTLDVVLEETDKYYENSETVQVAVVEEDDKIYTSLFIDTEDTDLDNTLIVSGILYDENFVPLSGKTIKIIVTYNDTEVLFTTTTDDDGFFQEERRSLHIGDVNITAVYEGDDAYYGSEDNATAVITGTDTIVHTPIIDWVQDDTYIVDDDIVLSGDVYYLDDEGRVYIDNLKIYATIVYANGSTYDADAVKTDEGTFKIVIPASENVLGPANITITTDPDSTLYDSVSVKNNTTIVEEFTYETYIYLDIDDDPVITEDFTVSGTLVYIDEDGITEIELGHQDITVKVIYDDDILNPTIQIFPTTTDEFGEFTIDVTPCMPGKIAIVATYNRNDTFASTTNSIDSEISLLTPDVMWEDLDDEYDILDDIQIGAYISYNGEGLTTENITLPNVIIQYSDGSVKEASEVTLDEDGWLTATFEAPQYALGEFDVYILIEGNDIFNNTISQYDEYTEITQKETPEITIDLDESYTYKDDILISGYVYDSEGNPIEDMEITLTIIFNGDVDNAQTITLEDLTDEDGYYEYTLEGVDKTGIMTVIATNTEDYDYYQAEATATTTILKETYLDVDIDETTILEPYTISGVLYYSDETGEDLPLEGQLIKVIVTYEEINAIEVFYVPTEADGSFSVSSTPLTSGGITVTAEFVDEDDEYADAIDIAEGEIAKVTLSILFEPEEEWYTTDDLPVTATVVYEIDGVEYDLTEDDISLYRVTMTIEGDNTLYIAQNLTFEDGMLTGVFYAPFSNGTGTITITRIGDDKFYEATNDLDEANTEFINKPEAIITIIADDTYYADEIEVIGTLTDAEDNPIEDGMIIIDVILDDKVIDSYTTFTDEDGFYSIDIPTDEEMIGETVTLVARFTDDDYACEDDTVDVKVLVKETSLMVDVDSVTVLDQVTIFGTLEAEDSTGTTGIEDQIITLTIILNGNEENALIVKTVTDEEGNYQITLLPTAAGTINVTAYYAGNTEYPEATAEAEGTISKIELFIEPVVDDEAYVDDDLIVTTQVSCEVEGELVYLKDDDPSLYTVTMTIEGSDELYIATDVTFEGETLTAVFEAPFTNGTGTITITRAEDKYFSEATGITTIEFTTKSIANITIDADETVYYADDIIVTGTLADITEEEKIPIEAATITIDVILDDEVIDSYTTITEEDGTYAILIPTSEEMIGETITLVARFEDDDYQTAEDNTTVDVLVKETTLDVDVDSVRIIDPVTIYGSLVAKDSTGEENLANKIITLTVIYNEDLETAKSYNVLTDEEGNYQITLTPKTTGTIEVYATFNATGEYPEATAYANGTISKVDLFVYLESEDYWYVDDDNLIVTAELSYEFGDEIIFLSDDDPSLYTVTMTIEGNNELFTASDVAFDGETLTAVFNGQFTNGTGTITITRDETPIFNEASETTEVEFITKSEATITIDARDTYYADEIEVSGTLFDTTEAVIVPLEGATVTIEVIKDGETILITTAEVDENGEYITYIPTTVDMIGDITLQATFIDEDYTCNEDAFVEIEVLTKDTTLLVTIEASTMAEPIIISGSIFAEDATGEVELEYQIITLTVTYNDDEANAEIYKVLTDKNGEYQINITPTTTGTVKVTATFDATGDYPAAEDEDVGEITKATPIIEFVGEWAYDDEDIIITAPIYYEDSEGKQIPITMDDINDINVTITYSDGTSKDATEVSIVDGEIIATIPAEHKVGDATVTIKTGETDIFADATAEEEFEIVEKPVANIIVEIDSATIIDPVTISGYLSAGDDDLTYETVTLTVTYNDEITENYTAETDENGVFQLNITPTTTGTVKVTATFESPDYTTATDDDEATISLVEVFIDYEADTTTYADEDILVVAPVYYIDAQGEEVPLTIDNITDITVTITYNDGTTKEAEDVTIENGEIVATIPAEHIVGDATITITTGTTDIFANATATGETTIVTKPTATITVQIDSATIIDPVTISGYLSATDVTGDSDITYETVTLTVTYNDEITENYTAETDENGEFQLNITPTTTGTVKVTATFESPDYTTATDDDEAIITKADVYIDFETEEWAYTDENITINAPIYYIDAEDNEIPLTNDNITDITITIVYSDGTNQTITDATIEDGQISATIPAEHIAGDATITITTETTDIFNNATATSDITIIQKSKATITIDANNTYYADKIEVTGTLFNTTISDEQTPIEGATVTIELMIDGEVFGTYTAEVLDDGTYTTYIPTTADMIGEAITLKASFTDDDYIYTEATKDIEVLTKETFLTVQVDSSRIIDPVTISGVLEAVDSTGDIELEDQIIRLTVIYNGDVENAQTYKVLTDEDGYFEKIIKPTQIGNITVFAEYYGTTEYPYAVDEDEGNITKVDVYIDFETDSPVYDYNNITIDAPIYYIDAEGNEVALSGENVTLEPIVMLYDDGVTSTSVIGTIVDGRITAIIPAPNIIGTATITIKSIENDYFLSAEASDDVEIIERAELIITVNAENTVYPDYIEISGMLESDDDSLYPADINISVKYGDDDVMFYSTTTDETGAYTYSIPTTEDMIGKVNITVSYLDDNNYAENSTVINLTQRGKTNIIFEFDKDEYTKGDTVTITGNVTDSLGVGIEGLEVIVTIQYNDGETNSTIISPTDVNGSFTYSFEALESGILTVTTTSVQTAEFNESEYNASVNVKAPPVQTEIIIVAYESENYGKDIYIHDGDVIYSLEDVNINVEGLLSVLGEQLDGETVNLLITVNYTDESKEDLKLNKTLTTISITGYNFDDQFTVTDNATVTVQAIYYGREDVYLPNSTDVITFSVVKEEAVIQLTVNDTEIELGESTNITAQIVTSITGKLVNDYISLTVKDSEGNPVATISSDSGSVTYIFTPDKLDIYNATAENEFIGSDSQNISVGGKYNRQSQITLIDIEDIYYQNREASINGALFYQDLIPIRGQNVTVTITYSDKTSENYTAITDDGGRFTVTINPQKLGVANVTASFIGNQTETEIFTPATSEEYPTEVLAVIDTKITIDNTEATALVPLNITGKLTDTQSNPIIGEELTVTVNGKEYNVITGENGNYSVEYTPLNTDDIIVKVDYYGSEKYNENTTNTTIPVKAKKVTMTVNPNNITGKVDDEFTVTVSFNDETINSGVVTLTDENDNILAVIDVENGAGITVIDFDEAYTGNIIASYHGDNNYDIANVTVPADIKALKANITINPIADAKVGDEVTVTGTILDENGNPVAFTPVTVNDEVVITDESGNFEATVVPTTEGEHNVTVTLPESERYQETNKTASYTASKKNATIAVELPEDAEIGKETTISGKVTDSEGNPVEGVPVTVEVNGEPTTVTTDENGEYEVPYTPTKAGENTVKVTVDDDTYKADPVEGSFTSDKQTATITVDDVDSEVDTPTNITGTVTDDEGNPVKDAKVIVTIDGTPTNATTDENGTFSVPYTPTKAGEHTVQVALDNDKYQAEPVKDTFDTDKHDATVTVDSVKDPKLGLETEITGTVTDEEGKPLANKTVTVTVNGKPTNVTTDKNGKYSLPITPTSEGTNNVTVELADNDKYEADPVKTTFDAEKQDYTVTVDPVTNATAGKPTNVTGTVTDEEGNPVAGVPVTVSVNGKNTTKVTDKDGKYSVPVTPQAGTNVVTVSIPESENGTAQTVTQTITATKQPSKITLPAIAAVTVGDTINITGTLTDADGKAIANANVIVNIEGKSTTVKTDSTGKFKANATATDVGQAVVTASYNGDNTYEAASPVTRAVTVNKHNTTTTVTKVTGKTHTNITVTATVKDENNKNANGGVVIFTDGNNTQLGTANVTNGKASVVVNYNISFTGKVTASYTGSDNYTKSTGSNTMNITKLKTSLTIDPIRGKVFDTIPVTVHVTDENGNKVQSGKVIFKVNGLTVKDENNETLRAVVVDGVATANITTTKTWLNVTSFVAKYIGDDAYEASQNTTKDINITKRVANIELASDRTIARGGDQVVFTAIVTDEGKAVTGGVVIFKINGETIKDASGKAIKVQVVNGTATLVYDLPLGMSAKNLTILAVYSNEIYNRAENTSTLSIVRMDVYFNTSIVRTSTTKAHVSATLRDAYGNLCVGTTAIALKCNGKTLAKVDAVEGIVNTDIDVSGYPVGTHTLEYVAGLNNRYNSVRMTNALVIEKA